MRFVRNKERGPETLDSAVVDAVVAFDDDAVRGALAELILAQVRSIPDTCNGRMEISMALSDFGVYVAVVEDHV